MKEMLRYGFILGLICFLASGVLAVVNEVTEPKIKLQKEKDETQGLKEVMPEGVLFVPKIEADKIIYYVVYNDKHKPQGVVIKAQGRGYSSDIDALAGLNLNLEITDIKILFQNETPGLGNRIIDIAFLSQFKGKNSDSLSEIQAITGATISSSALTNAIKNKILELKGQLSQDIENER